MATDPDLPASRLPRSKYTPLEDPSPEKGADEACNYQYHAIQVHARRRIILEKRFKLSPSNPARRHSLEI